MLAHYTYLIYKAILSYKWQEKFYIWISQGNKSTENNPWISSCLQMLTWFFFSFWFMLIFTVHMLKNTFVFIGYLFPNHNVQQDLKGLWLSEYVIVICVHVVKYESCV